MACEHWKRCGDCHSPALVAGLREVEESLRRDVERLTKALEEREADMHLRIRRGYDKTVADCWRAKVAEVERERDAAYAASVRSDEVHAEAMRSVRARAEKAEAQVAAHLESLETYEDRIHEIAADALGYQDPAAASIVLLDALERDYHRQRIARIQAEAQVERLRGALRALESCVVWCDSTQSYGLYQRVRDVLGDARAALADAREDEHG